MNIGLVVYGDLEQTSGGYRYDRKLVSALEARGDGVDVISIPRRSSLRNLADGFSRSLRTRLDQPYDVLVQDELCHPSLVFLNSRLERPNSIVSIVHSLRSAGANGIRAPLSRTIERRYLESVNAAVCTSRDTRDRTVALANLPATVAPPGGRVEGAGVPTARVSRRATNAADPLRVTFIGNVIRRKRARAVVSALGRADCEWRLTVVGSLEEEPAYARSVVAEVRDCGVEDRVTFTGRVTDSELECVLERSHVLAVPARYEGFGMVHLEAMEYGVVPIAGTVGGADEFVDHGRNGYLVDPSRPSAITAIVEHLEADRNRLTALGVAALETAVKHPPWAETMTRVRSFLIERASDSDRSEPGSAPRSTLESESSP
ncbi:glycosyltransferase family 4 protein [Halostagnicola sp. A-GB9-2]|uniref:glycosyltransferase family 4 protein n=1 Tax=Halostagnicola sp. A-GB9-2 TaxID=3048066 RepID=UPI0024BFCDF4|nr:glycosyltransferase family 4 protein [Halostagnicola sp. A-GB9-2]MDJ1430908.1 glycosyltransferase family 4 protein [Halostagnicola sp. A-GB9-2]